MAQKLPNCYVIKIIGHDNSLNYSNLTIYPKKKKIHSIAKYEFKKIMVSRFLFRSVYKEHLDVLVFRKLKLRFTERFNSILCPHF